MKHFTIEELTHSDTAIGHGIANNPSAVERENLRRLAERVLDPARERLGAPIYVNSGYRNCAVNRLVGGARRSYHLQGRAADLDTRSGRNAELMRVNLQHKTNIIRIYSYEKLIHHYCSQPTARHGINGGRAYGD